MDRSDYWTVFAASVPVDAASAAVDIEALKEEIKQELRNERPWNEDIASWRIDVHGFVSQGYMDSERYNYLLYGSKGGSFQFNEIGINFSKELTDKLRIGIPCGPMGSVWVCPYTAMSLSKSVASFHSNLLVCKANLRE